MRKLITSQLVSLDGVMQDPGGFGELPHGGWALGLFNDEAQQHAIATCTGRATCSCAAG